MKSFEHCIAIAHNRFTGNVFKPLRIQGLQKTVYNGPDYQIFYIIVKNYSLQLLLLTNISSGHKTILLMPRLETN